MLYREFTVFEIFETKLYIMYVFCILFPNMYKDLTVYIIFDGKLIFCYSAGSYCIHEIIL